MNRPRARKGFAASDAAFESLEGRTFLSAVLIGDVLIVEGDAGNNQRVVDAGAAQGQVVLTGVPGVTNGTLYSGVNRVAVRGRAGDDTITINDALLTSGGAAMPISVNAGAGNDTIN